MNSIRKSSLTTALLFFVLYLGAQDTITRSLAPFQNLSVIGKMRVELYKSDTAHIELFVNRQIADNIISEVKNNTLSIRLKTDTDKNSVIKVSLYYSNLSDISVAANTLLVSPETLKSEKINFIARSGAKMELNLDVKTLNAEVKQGAILVFTGKVNQQNITINTGATYSAYKLLSENTYVTANAGSKAKVCASRIIDATSGTKSYVGYIGTPVSVYVKTNLGGEIASFANEEAVFEE
jgi:hypothetical protein